MVDAVSKIAANERHRGETMLEFPGQQHADRHFAPGNCVLGCTKVTLTEDCSMSVFPPLECTQRPLRVKSRPHGITQTHHVRFTSDCVAKVVLRWSSKILRAVGAVFV